MSARIGFSTANVTVTPANGGDAVVHEGVGILVRAGRARLSTPGGQLVAQLDGVLTGERLEPHHWLVTFATGERWDVVKVERACGGCTQRRARRR